MANQGIVPIAPLMEVAGGMGGQQLQGIIQEVIRNVQQVLTAQEQGGQPPQR